MQTNLKELLQNGAIILDVRNKEEFNTGHVEGAINIPVNDLPNHINELKAKGNAIITCCFSGKRAGMAEEFLKSNGINNVVCGGGWQELQEKLI
jgi:phage shock protein E